MEQGLYPLKFLPLFKNKPWGGNKIRDLLGVDYSPLPNCGELWVLSAIEGQETVVENGFLTECTLPEILEMYADELVGEENYKEFGDYFPLLFKIIDAQDNLSVQVHPDDDFAQNNGYPNGKTEMWYVMDNQDDAIIYSGWNKKMTKAEVINKTKDGTIAECLNAEKVQKGDLFFIPAGRVHAIGKNSMVAEIQQSSDTTYRLFDWNKVDENGKGRKLHIEEALQVLDLNHTHHAKSGYDYTLNKTSNLLTTPFFTTNLISINLGLRKDYSTLDSFVVLFCTSGEGYVEAMGHKVPIKASEVILLPAICQEANIIPKGLLEVLEIFIV